MTTKTRTFRLSGRDMERTWHVIDAADRPLGRVASDVAQLLLGKHKPTYEPHLAMGDYVVVINAAQVALTGNKAEEKVYYRHSGYPGGLKTRSFAQQMERDPRKVIERAVRGMLPHNSRGRELFRHLKVYATADHPHEAQVRAGTGARARRRVAAAERAAAAPSAPIEEPTGTTDTDTADTADTAEVTAAAPEAATDAATTATAERDTPEAEATANDADSADTEAPADEAEDEPTPDERSE